jgi:hypothetical protein
MQELPFQFWPWAQRPSQVSAEAFQTWFEVHETHVLPFQWLVPEHTQTLSTNHRGDSQLTEPPGKLTPELLLPVPFPPGIEPETEPEPELEPELEPLAPEFGVPSEEL